MWRANERKESDDSGGNQISLFQMRAMRGRDIEHETIAFCRRKVLTILIDKMMKSKPNVKTGT